MNVQLQREREAEVQAMQAARSAEQGSGGGGGGGGGKGWNEDDLQLLIKAVNLFPAGTNARFKIHECLARWRMFAICEDGFT